MFIRRLKTQVNEIQVPDMNNRKTFKELYSESRETYEKKSKDIDAFLDFSNRIILEKNAKNTPRVKSTGLFSNLGLWLGLSWLFG